MVRFAMLVIGVCSIGQAQAQDHNPIPRSHVCKFHGGGWARAGGVAPAHAIVMSNDGGWCGHKGAYTTMPGRIMKGAPHTVVQQPQFGQIVIVPEPTGAEGVFYRPQPGFTGSDIFTIHNEMLNQDRIYNVVVK